VALYFEGQINKTALLQTVFLAILPTVLEVLLFVLLININKIKTD